MKRKYRIFLWSKNAEGLLTIVVSVIEPKLLIKILQVTFTGGPAGRNNKNKNTYTHFPHCSHLSLHLLSLMNISDSIITFHALTAVHAIPVPVLKLGFPLFKVTFLTCIATTA